MTTENQIDGPKARELREELRLSQKDFWSLVGVQQSVGCRYEAGQAKIPKPVRMLIVERFVATKDDTAKLRKKLASAQAFERESRALIRKAHRVMQAATEELGKVAGDA